MRGGRAPLLLLLAWAGLAAAAYDAIILKMAEGEFVVQSGEDLGQPVGDRLLRLRLAEGADVEAELVRLRSLNSESWLPFHANATCKYGLLLCNTHAAVVAACRASHPTLASAMPPLPFQPLCTHTARFFLFIHHHLPQAWSGRIPTCPSARQQ